MPIAGGFSAGWARYLNPAERSDEETKEFGKDTPLGRPAQPDEVAKWKRVVQARPEVEFACIDLAEVLPLIVEQSIAEHIRGAHDRSVTGGGACIDAAAVIALVNFRNRTKAP